MKVHIQLKVKWKFYKNNDTTTLSDMYSGSNWANQGNFSGTEDSSGGWVKINTTMLNVKFPIEDFPIIVQWSVMDVQGHVSAIVQKKIHMLSVYSRAPTYTKYITGAGEQTMDIAITPNRPDCLGMRGIARDLASSGLGKLKKQPPIKINQKFKQPIKVSIGKEKDQGCAIFGSVYIKNVQNKESPDWLKKKIISLGLKPVSAIVDATNYVMFDLNLSLIHI